MSYFRLTLGLSALIAGAAPATAQVSPNPVTQYPNFTASQVGISPRAAPDTGMSLLREQDAYGERVASFIRSVRHLSGAQRSVAWTLYLGDYARALTELATLAATGDPWAYRQLGWMHAQGLGVPLDARMAFDHFREAARRGDAPSALAVGLALQLGDGVEADAAQSDYWLARAQETGDRPIRRDATRLRRRNRGG